MTRIFSILILSTLTAVSAPVISGVAIPATNATMAMIIFSTDVPAISTAEWGSTASYGTRDNSTADYTTTHEHILHPLTPGQTVHYRLSTTAADGTSSTNTGSFVGYNGNEFYAATNGDKNNPGTFVAPWDIHAALGGGRSWSITAATNIAYTGVTNVQPGDTIYLRGGTYTGLQIKDQGDGKVRKSLFRVGGLKGTTNLPIVVRSYSGELAILDGGIDSGGNISTGEGTSVWWWAGRTQDSGTNRFSTGDTSIARYPAMNMLANGPFCRVINWDLRNGGHPGLGWWDQGYQSEVYGCTIWGSGIIDYNNSIPGSQWDRGSGIYTQNDQPDPTRIQDNFVFWNLTEGVHGYTQSGGVVGGYTLLGNTFFECNDRVVLMTGEPGEDFFVYTNQIYLASNHVSYETVYPLTTNHGAIHRPNGLALGLQAHQQENVIASGNYIASTRATNWLGTYEIALSVRNWENLVVTNNTVIGGVTTVDYVTNLTSVTATWDNNHYFHPNDWTTTPFSDSSVGYNFADWQGLYGFDSSSTYSDSRPSNNHIVVRPNKYERGRAHITVYNWEGLSSVTVTTGDIMESGDTYVVFDVQWLDGDPVASGTYNGSTVTIPMAAFGETDLVGETQFQTASFEHTDEDFGAFLLLRSEEQTVPQEDPPAAPQRFRVGRGRRPAFFP